MDPFQKLPPELLSEILIYLDREDLPQATSVSPALFRTEVSLRAYIARHHTLCDLCGDINILQDALALLKFPTFSVQDVQPLNEHTTESISLDLQLPITEHSSFNTRTVATDSHLRTWAAGRFQDPFIARDTKTMADLDRLCRHIWLFASDYLSKATHSHPPTAYDRLPQWAASETPEQEYKPSPLAMLTSYQRGRLLQAFIQYEILCKVFRPVSKVTDNDADTSLGYRHGPKAWKHSGLGPFRHWSWSLLQTYKGGQTGRVRLDLLASVREYVLCTFACLNTRDLLRSSGEQSQLQRLSTEPSAREDTEYLEVYNIRSVTEAQLRGEEMDSAMATCGLGTLSHCLRLTPTEMSNFKNSLYGDLRKYKPRAEPTSTQGMIVSTDTAPWHVATTTRWRRQRAMDLFEEDDSKLGKPEVVRENNGSTQHKLEATKDTDNNGEQHVERLEA